MTTFPYRNILGKQQNNIFRIYLCFVIICRVEFVEKLKSKLNVWRLFCPFKEKVGKDKRKKSQKYCVNLIL